MTAKARPRRETGGAVMNQILAYLATLGFRDLERVNTGCATYEGKGGKRRFVRYGRVGTSDIGGTIPRGPNRGKKLAIEAKATGEHPTPEQMNYILDIIASGGIAFWTDALKPVEIVMPHILAGARIGYKDIDRWHVVYPHQEPLSGEIAIWLGAANTGRKRRSRGGRVGSSS